MSNTEMIVIPLTFANYDASPWGLKQASSHAKMEVQGRIGWIYICDIYNIYTYVNIIYTILYVSLWSLSRFM